MAIKHVKVATVPDDGISEVGTDEWNDNHTIEDNTITDDMVSTHTTTKITVPTTQLSGTVTNTQLAGSIDNTKLATDPLARANHTGTQAQSTITDLTTDLTSKAPIASPTFTGVVAIPNVSNLETAVVANTAKVSLEDNAVTLAKLAHGTAGTYLGFNDSTGVPEEKTVSAGGQQGDFVIATNTTLAEYTEISNESLTVSSDPNATLTGNVGFKSLWGYPLTQGELNKWGDGDDSTGATADSGNGEGAVVGVDFQTSQTGIVYAYFTANSTPTVHFEYSTDNSTWTTIQSYNVTTSASVFHTLVSSSSVTFRYLRLRTTSFNGYAYIHLRSLGIDGLGKRALLDNSNATSWESSSESTPYVYFDMESDLELASIAINLNRTLTTVTNLTIEYSSDNTFSGETVRTLAVSDFTDDTTRYINIPRNQDAKRYCKIAGVGTGVLSINYLRYKTEVSDVWSRRHYHTYLNPTSTSSNTLDSN